MFPDGLLGSRLFAFNPWRWWHSHMFSPETSACSQCPGDSSSKQSWHRKTEAAVMYNSTPGCRARVRVFSLCGIPVSPLGAHRLLDSSAYAFCLWRNFSGHLNLFRGFQPGSASEAPGNFRKIQTYEPHPILLNQYFLKASQVTLMIRPGLRTNNNPPLTFQMKSASFPSSKGNLFNRYLFCNYFVSVTMI